MKIRYWIWILSIMGWMSVWVQSAEAYGPCKTCNNNGTCVNTGLSGCYPSLNECDSSADCQVIIPAPCRECNGQQCVYTGAPACNNSLNECGNNNDCCNPSCSCASSTPVGQTCSDGCGGSCSGTMCVNNCSNSVETRCVAGVPIFTTCVYGCNGTVCKAQPNYCEVIGCCTRNDSGGTKRVRCWTDATKTSYVGEDCVTSNECTSESTPDLGCNPLYTSCGGNAVCPPGQVSHIDNCGGLDCGAPCVGSGGGGSGCTNTNPVSTTVSIPTNGSLFVSPDSNYTVNFDWASVTGWGDECSGTIRTYNLCIGTNATNPCSAGETVSISDALTPDAPPSLASHSVSPGPKYWSVQAVNKANYVAPISNIGNFCVEGFVAPASANVGNSYVTAWSAWSTCNANADRSRTRTCTPSCGSSGSCDTYFDSGAGCDNVAGCSHTCNAGGVCTQTEIGKCQATITGRLFDASECVDCSCMNNPSLAIGARQFEILHPSNSWGPYTPTTNGSGTYSQSVFAYNPGTYNFDLGLMEDTYPKVKFYCEGMNVSLTTQGQVATRNIGMWRNFGGWWQTEGAGVWAKGDVRSLLPATLDTEDQVLVKQNSNSRAGMVVYGNTMNLGVNDDAKPNLSGWQAQSDYRNITFGYRYFTSTLSTLTSTEWDGVGSLPAYNDTGKGYMYVKVPSGMNLNGMTIDGGKKYILLVNGNVAINGYINVTPGSFLMLVSSGNISVNSGLGQEYGETSPDKTIEGWYVADGSIRFESTGDENTDLRFVGEGSFVAWNGFEMLRNRGAKNNYEPSQKFVYRSDMLLSAPDVIKLKSKEYSEFVP